MPAGTKIFSGLSVKDHPTIIDDKHSPDLANCRIDSPIGALSNMEGIEKYNSVGFGAAIVAIHQLNGHIFSLSGSKLYEGTPYTAITDCAGLQAMQDNLAGKYYLANDIDCTYCTQDPAGALYNAGAGFEPVGTIATPFTGVFDGNGYTITGLKINRPATNYIGLFGVCRNVEIKNVGMINVDTSGNDDVGSLVGLNRNDNTVTNCYATGAVSGVGGIGGGTGGLVGRNYSSSIMTNCYSTCVVSGNPYIGGLVGRNNSGVYADCFWDTETSGQATSAGGTGKTTAQMKQEATFTNWDFTTIWAIVEDTSYPTLR